MVFVTSQVALEEKLRVAQDPHMMSWACTIVLAPAEWRRLVMAGPHFPLAAQRQSSGGPIAFVNHEAIQDHFAGMETSCGQQEGMKRSSLTS